VPLAGLPAVDAGAVGAGAGVPGLALKVAKPSVYGLPDHLVDLADQGGPVGVAVLVACLAGEAGVLAEGGVGKIEMDLDSEMVRSKNSGLCRARFGGFDAQFTAAFGGGVRLGGQQFRIQISRFAAVSGRPSQRGAVGCLSLAEPQIVGPAVDPLTGRTARFRAVFAWRKSGVLTRLIAWPVFCGWHVVFAERN